MKTFICLIALCVSVAAAPPIAIPGSNTNDTFASGFFAQNSNATKTVQGIIANRASGDVWPASMLPGALGFSSLLFGGLISTNEIYIATASTNHVTTNVSFITVFADTGVTGHGKVVIDLDTAASASGGNIINITRTDKTTNSVVITNSLSYWLGNIADVTQNLFPYGLTNGESLTLQLSQADGLWHIASDARSTNGFVTVSQLQSATNTLAASTTNLVNGATNTLAQSISNYFALMSQVLAQGAAISNLVAAATNTLDASKLDRNTVPDARLAANIARTNNGVIQKVVVGANSFSNGPVTFAASGSASVDLSGSTVTFGASGGGGGASDPFSMNQVTLSSQLQNSNRIQELDIVNKTASNYVYVSVGGTDSTHASHLGFEPWDQMVSNGGVIIYRGSFDHSLHFGQNLNDVFIVRDYGSLNLVFPNIGLDDDGNLDVTGKLTGDGGIDPPYLMLDAMTRALVKARVLLEVPDAKTNLYWIGLIGPNNHRVLLSNSVTTTMVDTNTSLRVITATTNINLAASNILAMQTNFTVNSVLTRTNVEASKLTGASYYFNAGLHRTEYYVGSEDGFYTLNDAQITNNIPTTNQVLNAISNVLSARSVKKTFKQLN